MIKDLIEDMKFGFTRPEWIKCSNEQKITALRGYIGYILLGMFLLWLQILLILLK